MGALTAETGALPDDHLYDELPYCDYAIAQTAPEVLSMVSLFHGGPRVDAANCRVLELGCASGGNLLPMAWYRPGCSFVGVDYSTVQIDRARAGRAELGLDNVDFLLGDFEAARRDLEGPFDIIMAHGVFSWIDDEVRDDLMVASRELLADGGLLYLNYNALPGWKVRGMVRDFLLAQTAGMEDLRARSERCRELAAAVIGPLGEGEHPYTQLLEREFRMVTQHDPAYIAHEYITPRNRPYWRSEFEALVGQWGFETVAEATFNDLSYQIIDELTRVLDDHPLLDGGAGDAADLLCYSQMHCPVLARAPLQRTPCSDEEFTRLWMASPLGAEGEVAGAYAHPDGRTIQTSAPALREALDRLNAIWPRAERLDDLLPEVPALREDLELLYGAGLIDLRTVEPGQGAVEAETLHRWERSRHDMSTSPWHTLEAAAS